MKKTMTCDKFQNIVRQALGVTKKAPSDEMCLLVEEHAKQCASCGEWYETEKLGFVLALYKFS